MQVTVATMSGDGPICGRSAEREVVRLGGPPTRAAQ